MAFLDRSLPAGKPKVWAGRPSKTNTNPTYLLTAGDLNSNMDESLLRTAFAQALGTEITDAGSVAGQCRLLAPPGRFAVGDQVVIREDRGTDRTWSVAVTTIGVDPAIVFDDGDLQDVSKAGTADYDAIKNDLLVVQVNQLGKAVLSYHSLLFGGAHGLDGTKIPWMVGAVGAIDSIEDKFNALSLLLGAVVYPPHNQRSFIPAINAVNPAWQLHDSYEMLFIYGTAFMIPIVDVYYEVTGIAVWSEVVPNVDWSVRLTIVDGGGGVGDYVKTVNPGIGVQDGYTALGDILTLQDYNEVKVEGQVAGAGVLPQNVHFALITKASAGP